MDVSIKRDVAQAIRSMGREVVELGEWQEILYEKMTSKLANPIRSISAAVDEMIEDGSIVVRENRDVVRFGKLWLRAASFKSYGSQQFEVVSARVFDLDDRQCDKLYGVDGTSHEQRSSGYFVR